MKKSIKLKCGSDLDGLLSKPAELALLVSIAIHMDGKTGLSPAGKVKRDAKALENLKSFQIIKEEPEGLRIVNRKIIDFTISRTPEQKRELDRKNIWQVQEWEVPEEDATAFKIAMSFATVFLENIKRTKGIENHIKEAKYGKWVTPVRLMIEKDGITIEQFREIYTFLDGHHFWAANVQGTSKLREKFPTLYSQLKQNEQRTAKQQTGISAEYAQRVIEDLQSE